MCVNKKLVKYMVHKRGKENTHGLSLSLRKTLTFDKVLTKKLYLICNIVFDNVLWEKSDLWKKQHSISDVINLYSAEESESRKYRT